MKRTRHLIALILFVASVAAMASTDPFVGKWVLKTQRSHYPAGTCPRRMVIEMESAGKGVHYRSDTIYANGANAHSEYTADYDGNSALVMGNRGMLLPVFLKRPDSHTVVASYTKSLKIVATSRRVVSPDGRRMTITTVSKDQSGKNVKSVGVYERQREK